MYSDIESVGILVALLKAHGVDKAVVCPGSRNAPITNDLRHAMDVCVPVTDERSAGFYALGMTLDGAGAVAVCVTSGTAVLNLAPAVAEAYHRHLPVVVISADRPADAIGRMLPQTLDQPGVLSRFVKHSVNLPECTTPAQYALCQRLVNEAMTAALQPPRGPVHINVPLSEPLFGFSHETLPPVRATELPSTPIMAAADIEMVWTELARAERPLIVIGQTSRLSKTISDNIRHVAKTVPVMSEPLSCDGMPSPLDDALATADAEIADYAPDVVLQIGGQFVTRRLSDFVTRKPHVRVITLSDGGIYDTFGALYKTVRGSAEDFFADESIMVMAAMPDAAADMAARWHRHLEDTRQRIFSRQLKKDEASVVRVFEQRLDERYPESRKYVHYANSLAVRLGCAVSSHYIYVNRGVNGIEGSVSTAAGHSVVTADPVFCVVGDLSFFYDSNALWCGAVRGNLHVLLLNNGKGAIFDRVAGMPTDAHWQRYVAGTHNATAKGICQAYGADYIDIDDYPSMELAMEAFMSAHSRPVVMEVKIY